MEKSQGFLRHLGIIADGNRRWAKERGLPKIEGHRAGIKTVEILVNARAAKKGCLVSCCGERRMQNYILLENIFLI